MKSFDDFVKLVEANQNILADKAMADANAIISNSNMVNFPEELKLAVATSLVASCKASLDLNLEMLRLYHRWSNQKQ